jgi:hypothetical protein
MSQIIFINIIFIAHTVKGLEKMAVEELASFIHDIKIVSTEVKNIYFETSEVEKLKDLRCIDDISILVGKKVLPNTHHKIGF